MAKLVSHEKCKNGSIYQTIHIIIVQIGLKSKLKDHLIRYRVLDKIQHTYIRKVMKALEIEDTLPK